MRFVYVCRFVSMCVCVFKCRFAANTIKKQSSSSQRTTNNAAVLFVDVIPVVIAVVVVVASVHSFHHQHHIFRRASVVIGFIFSISRHCLALALLWSQHFFFLLFLPFHPFLSLSNCICTDSCPCSQQCVC